MRTSRPTAWVIGLVVGALSMAALLLGPLASAAGAASSTPAAEADADFLGRVNRYRAERGLRALQRDGELEAVARRWSGSMATRQTLQHNPNLSREVTANWRKLAENVGEGTDVPTLFQAFVNSASHRRNLLDGEVTRIGVGTVVDSGGRLWTTHVFMQLAPARAAAPSPTTTAPKAQVAAAPRPTAAPATARPTTSRAPAPAPTSAPTTAATAPPTTAPAPTTTTVAPEPLAEQPLPTSTTEAPVPAPVPTILAAASQPSDPQPTPVGLLVVAGLVLGAGASAARLVRGRAGR